MLSCNPHDLPYGVCVFVCVPWDVNLMMGCWSHESQSSWALSLPFQTHPFTLDDAVSFLHISQLPGYQVNTDDKSWMTVCLTLLPPWSGLQPSPLLPPAVSSLQMLLFIVYQPPAFNVLSILSCNLQCPPIELPCHTVTGQALAGRINAFPLTVY